ncbi:hypothetical protein Cgig2_033227 [Carnegiea gigantea]|uniref:Uncharacterized protein n=1 Tax=Carnegiea gigantea TaxID=171969 RepID=A0A9Q1K2C7_9CARY|nr:hypothetical protein Cgig2_033227 [Carnegiea gigantea]
MEQNQSVSKFPMTSSYPPLNSVSHGYPLHHYDTMATHYVHSLTSSPYYYFIPHYSYATGRHYPHHHYAHHGPQFGFSRATISTSGVPNVHGQPSYLPPKVRADQKPKSQGNVNGSQVEKSDGSSEDVHANEVKSIDPRIINILEPFRQFYSEREETLKSILPGLHVNTLVLDTLKSDIDRSDARTLKRSLSLGSSPLRNEWFKVRPIDSDDTVIIPPVGKNGDEW